MSDLFASRSRLLTDIVREPGVRNTWSCRIAPGYLLDVYDVELATKTPGNELSMARIASVTANQYGWFTADFPRSAASSEYYCCLRGTSGNASPYILLGASVGMIDDGNGNLVAEQGMVLSLEDIKPGQWVRPGDTEGKVIFGVPSHSTVAFGLSPSGKPVPIRVDEDGYVLTRPTHVIGKDCWGEVAEDHIHAWKDGNVVAGSRLCEYCTVCGTYRYKPFTPKAPPGLARRYSTDRRTGKPLVDMVTQEFARAESGPTLGLPDDAEIGEYHMPWGLPERNASENDER
jgi:hypothetical protein